MLKGKKTYIIGICSILYGVTGVILGKHDYNTAITMIETAILGMTVRNGIS